MSKLKLLNIDLRMFDGAGAGAGTGGTASGDGSGTIAQGTDVSAQTTKADTNRNGSSRRSGRNTGALSNVVYGKQTSTQNNSDAGSAEGNTDVSTTSDTLEARRAAFEELISGEYKDLFTERTQGIIDRRFKETKSYEAKLNSQQPVIDMLMNKYKIADGDIAKLTEAIDKDDTYWEEAAEEEGLTVEQYKQVQKLKRENEAFRRAQQRQIGQQQANAQINEWMKQADAVKSIYPDFDFKREIADRNFLQMLKNGVPVQKAYEVMHIDDLVTGAARTAARQAEQNTVAKIKNKASRPSENGTSSSSSAIVKSDVSKLTKADRAEIARRAARGEIIRF